MRKEEIIRRFSCMSEAELNQMVEVYKKYKPQKNNDQQLFSIPEHIKKLTEGFKGDTMLKRILEDLPTHLTPIEAPSKNLAEKAKKIYMENCFCFDEIGEIFVHTVLEYATFKKARPLIIYGPAGGGKSHRVSVMAKMVGLHRFNANIPLSTNTGGLAGFEGSFQNSAPGLIVKGMIESQSCNYLFNGEELDKQAWFDRQPPFSDQFLKLLDQDATNFIDNRLGFGVNASHIIYVFTANDKTRISAPMLDRCEIIELLPPTKKEVTNIIRNGILPQSLERFRDNAEISFSEEAINFVIDSLWQGDNTSIRQYQSLISKCVNAANYTCICEERPVIIQRSDAEIQLRKMSAAITPKNRIGFA